MGYITKTNVTRDGVLYQKGEAITVTDEEAKALVDRDLIEEGTVDEERQAVEQNVVETQADAQRKIAEEFADQHPAGQEEQPESESEAAHEEIVSENQL